MIFETGEYTDELLKEIDEYWNVDTLNDVIRNCIIISHTICEQEQNGNKMEFLSPEEVEDHRLRFRPWQEIPLNYYRPSFTKCQADGCDGEILMKSFVRLTSKWNEEAGKWIEDGEYDDDPPEYVCEECDRYYEDYEILERYECERNEEVKWEKSNCLPKKIWKNSIES